jgi:hypothetical protein
VHVDEDMISVAGRVWLIAASVATYLSSSLLAFKALTSRTRGRNGWAS